MTAMYRRALQAAKGSFFLFGMRGVGKSTWAQSLEPAHHISLLRERNYQAFLANPDLFRQELLARPRGSTVVVDEIQRLPSLLNEVHALIEERRLRFVLLGSSARKLRRSGVNLLGGRATQRTMYPLLPSEMGKDYAIGQILKRGSLPLVLASDDPKETLTAYVETYLKEEIQAEALVRNLPGFARFLPVAALMHGQILSVESLARNAEVQRTTVNGFLDVLVDTLLADRLPAFEEKLRVKQTKHPKFYWLDAGVARAAKKQLGPVSLEEKGALFEGLVFQWLLAYRECGAFPFDEIGYWSVTGSQAMEVDFIITRGKEKFAVEAKATERIRDEHFRGLRAIADLNGLKNRIVVYMGEKVLRTEDGIDVWPWAHFVAWLQKQ